MKRIFNLLAAALLLITGCSEESFSRYPSVAVPGYGNKDYVRDLSSPNPELVYNAICNLGPRASRFGEQLSKKDADPASTEYRTAQKAYSAIRRTATSDHAQIAAASLRFLQLFAHKYEPRSELVQIALRVETDHPQVQFEKAALLSRLPCEPSPELEAAIRKLLKSPSWIVVRKTYETIGRNDLIPLRQELVKRYRNTEEEREKLLIISALAKNLQPEEALWLQEVMLSMPDGKIRATAGSCLLDHVGLSDTRAWFITNYQHFTSDERNLIFTETKDIELACSFLDLGYTPPDKVLQDILTDMLDVDPEKIEEDIKRFDRALTEAPQLGDRWHAIKAEAEQKRLKAAALHADLAPLSEEIITQVKSILTQHEIPESEQNQRLKKITAGLEALAGQCE